MKSIFITGIGTDVGKTFYIEQAIAQYKAAGQNWSAIKPITSGWNTSDIEHSDTGLLLKAQGLGLTQANLERVSPWRFDAPVSPHLAAAMENQTVHMDALVHFCRQAKKQCKDGLMIEGVGGLLVPINDHYTVLDWIEALHISVIVMGATYVGAINHALMTLSCLHERNIVVEALIINESIDSVMSLDETVSSIRLFEPNVKIQTLSRNTDSAEVTVTQSVVASKE